LLWSAMITYLQVCIGFQITACMVYLGGKFQFFNIRIFQRVNHFCRYHVPPLTSAHQFSVSVLRLYFIGMDVYPIRIRPDFCYAEKLVPVGLHSLIVHRIISYFWRSSVADCCVNISQTTGRRCRCVQSTNH